MVISNDDTGIPIFPGDNIQAEVDNNPDGTAFMIKAFDRNGNKGIHRMQQVNPKGGNSFIGEREAVLSGAMELNNDGWNPYTGDGCTGCWVHEGPDAVHEEVYHENHCTEYKSCQFPEDLFLNDRFCQQVASMNELVPFEGKEGEVLTWYFDRDGSRNIYMKGINPNAFDMEISVSAYAFGGRRIKEDGSQFPTTDPASLAKNVTIKNLIIEKYACPGQFGAIGYQDPGDFWTIEDNVIRLNHGTGIVAGSYSLIRNNKVVDNGQIGVKVSRIIQPVRIFNTRIEGNEISRNGKDEIGFDWSWEGGGTKFTKTTNLTVLNNVVRYNRGAGLWADIDNYNTVYENNVVENNLDHGIFHEISYKATIRNNKVRGNGIGRNWMESTNNFGDQMNHAQIMIASSKDVEVYNNFVDAGKIMNGIIIRNEYRDRENFSEGPDEEPSGNTKLYECRNVVVHHNKIVIPKGNPNGISGGWVNPDDFGIALSERGHNFDFNIYQPGDLSLKRWIWENGGGENKMLNFEEFQEVKQELNGKSISFTPGAFARYFNDGSQDFTSELVYPVVSRTEAQINFDWPEGTPDPKIGSRVVDQENNFSARYDGIINVDVTGNYAFRVIADDGIRFNIYDNDNSNSTIVSMEKWVKNQAQNIITESDYVVLEKEKSYPFRLEYFHRGMAKEMDAVLKLEWKILDGEWEPLPGEVISSPSDFGEYGLTGTYYDYAYFAGDQITRLDQQINFSWHKYAPDARMMDDGDFSVIWSGFVKPLYRGKYYFYMPFVSDDYEMISFLCNDVSVGPVVVDVGPNTYYRYEVDDVGEVEKWNVKIRYQKINSIDVPASRITFKWESIDKKQNFQIVPPYCLYSSEAGIPEMSNFGLIGKYYNINSGTLNEDGWANWPDDDAYPIISETSYTNGGEELDVPVEVPVDNINFDWEMGSPDYRIGADYFVSQWEGQITSSSSGTKEFNWETDDGGILEIGGQKIIDTWTNSTAKTTGTFLFDADKPYSFRARHFERGGSASARAVLEWRNYEELKSNFAQDFEVVPPSAFLFTTAVIAADEPLQDELKLYNYPNPFTGETFIRYELPYAGKVVLKIYNSWGKEIRVLVSGHQAPGSYQIEWNRLDDDSVPVPPGMYIYKLNAFDKHIQCGKMVVLK